MSALAPGPDPVVARVRRALLRRLVAAVVLIALLFGVSVLTPLGQLFGDLVLTGRPTDDPDRIAAAKDVLGIVSVTSLAVSALAIAGIAALRGRWWLAGAMLIAIGGANVTTQVLKRAVFWRPAAETDLGVGVLNSYPSGHATVIAVLALALVAVVPARLRPLAVLAGAARFPLVGSETITEGWHRAEDVVGAGLVALAWVAGMALAVVRLRGADVLGADATRGHLGAGRLLLAAALAVLTLGAFVWGEVLATGDELLSPLDAWTPAATRLYLGALLVTLATAGVVVVTLWRSIRPVDVEAVRGPTDPGTPRPATSR
ncbi:MAG: phosphatase PAP2 family protein [Chloroflexota bacterium]